MKILSTLIGIIASLALTSCDAPPPAATAEASLQSQKMALLHRICGADSSGRTFERALLNDEGELGVILDKSVQPDAIPPLMKSLLTQMAVDFSDQDITVVAYTPSAPPLKLGTAHLDANSREMIYTPVR